MSRFNPLMVSLFNAALKTVKKAFNGATESAAGTLGMVAAPPVGSQDKFLTGAHTWRTEKFRGAFSSTVGYEAGTFICVNGMLAYANGPVAKDIAFSWGTTGATWSPALDQNVSWQGLYNPSGNYAANAVVGVSNSQGLLYRSLNANNMSKPLSDITAWLPYHPMIDMSSLVNVASTGSNSSLTPSVLQSKVLLESIQLITTTITGAPAITLELGSGLVILHTTAPSSNWSLNVVMSGTQTLNAGLGIGQSVTFTHMVQMGTTAYMPTTISVDGQVKTELWAGGVKPTGGIASAVNCYSYTILKTADNSFMVLMDQGSFK